MDDETPWEPPLAGPEPAHLLGSLDRLRATFRWKTDGLDATGLRTTIAASSLTLAGLLKHLALVEEHYSTTRLTGEPLGPPWGDVDWDADPDWEFTTAREDTPADLYALYDASVARARTRFAAAVDEGGLDQPVHAGDGQGRHASLRRVLFDLVEEYGRHTGQADLVREAVDGRVGEDPPAGWRPTTG